MFLVILIKLRKTLALLQFLINDKSPLFVLCPLYFYDCSRCCRNPDIGQYLITNLKEFIMNNSCKWGWFCTDCIRVVIYTSVENANHHPNPVQHHSHLHELWVLSFHSDTMTHHHQHFSFWYIFSSIQTYNLKNLSNGAVNDTSYHSKWR